MVIEKAKEVFRNMKTEKTEFCTKLQENLQADETILWSGKSEKFPLKNEGNAKALTYRWIICAVLFAAFAVFYVSFNLRTLAVVKPAPLVVAFIVFIYIALVPALDRNKVLKKCIYIVTDKRIITVVSDRDVNAVSRAGLKIKAVPAGDGCVHLLFGAATELKERKYVIRTFEPVKEDSSDSPVIGIIFYHVKDTNELRTLLKY